ncbi:CHAT domain-containing protein [cf. Phormidesmis sp. LEGE 11477]|uniref:CHAT domain-containing protein n=1 Tax=cf. Phormidesmis sp. LEGE 11477 TaxID=1828680 RepID=UPI00187F772F
MSQSPYPSEAPYLSKVPYPSEELEQQGRSLYETGRFTEAVAVLQRAVTSYQQQGDTSGQAIALSNLALTYRQIGEWSQANDAIQTSLMLLTDVSAQASDRSSGLAQVLDIQGDLQFAQGRAEQALTRWQQAAEYYGAIDGAPDNAIGNAPDASNRLTQNRINQSRALQTLGFYQKSLTLLDQLAQSLATQPASLNKATALRKLGEGLRVVGRLEEAQVQLGDSLAIAQQLLTDSKIAEEAAESMALTQVSLGNTARAEQENETALGWYQQAADTSSSSKTQLQANLNQMSLLVEMERFLQAQQLVPTIQAQIEALPLSRTAVYARINLAESLSKTNADAEPLSSATLLSTAVKQSQQLGDQRTQSYALGLLGRLYENTRQWSSAKELTQQALQLSTAANATDVTYLWQWQLGRILKTQFEQGNAPAEKLEQNRTEAINLYRQAIETLQSLRLDIASINPDQQFSFRKNVEPAYREHIELLLHPVVDKPSQADLTAARDALESLQTVELQNFFREACLDVPIAIDQVVEETTALAESSTNALAAVVYPIILSDSLEIVLKLPDQSELLHYSTQIAQDKVESTLLELRHQITQPDSLESVQSLSQRAYDWLIRPAEQVLQAEEISTLVFVLDGFLKNIPMAALYDGSHYLVETYGVALTPGLELFNPQPIERQGLRLLFAGLSDSVEGFSSLEAVEVEKEGIVEEVSQTTVLLNQTFTAQALETEIEQTPFDIVHLATHGEFSSDRNKTFIRSSDRRMTMDELDRILQTRQARPDPIELLALSACETAEGDEQAALGLAGVAVRAGARSTLASLWSTDDRSNAFLMIEFYRQLMQNPSFSKSQALRQAQLKLVTHPNYGHPSYWAPYVLLGNWL